VTNFFESVVAGSLKTQRALRTILQSNKNCVNKKKQNQFQHGSVPGDRAEEGDGGFSHLAAVVAGGDDLGPLGDGNARLSQSAQLEDVFVRIWERRSDFTLTRLARSSEAASATKRAVDLSES
jgi:hypothetical protein